MKLLSCGGAVLLAAAFALPSCVRAQGAPLPVDAGLRAVLLDVPFVPQSEALCGGAALAMVLRYWGVRNVHAEDFASLVTDTGEGIRTSDLTAAARARGLRAQPFVGERDAVRALLAARRPVIALIEDRPGVYHYVVLLAWAGGRVLFHDPAIGPHRVMTERELERAWAPAKHWTLLVGPTDAHTVTPADSARDVGAGTSAGSSDRADALRAFEAAQYTVTATLAARMIARDSTDAFAWRLLAASRYLLDDNDGALRAWNRVGEPISDLTRIDGLRRTPYHVVNDAIAIAVGAHVTPAALARARRRVSAVPTITRARVDYRPIAEGVVEIDAAVVERPRLPLGWPDIAVHAVRAAVESRAQVELTNVLRSGERWRVAGGWEHNRRSFTFGVDAPGVFGMRPLTNLDVGVRTTSFALEAVEGVSGDIARETRRSFTLGIGDWASGMVRWQAGIALDDWEDRATYGGARGGVALHAAGDRVILHTDVSGWWPSDDGDWFSRVRVGALLRTPAARGGYEASLTVGAQAVSAHAPRDLWHGAGTGRGTPVLLRAHPLVADDGVIRSRYWAPSLAHASLELRRWLASIGPVDAGVAVFVDAAGVRGTAADPAGRTAVDGGGGIRLGLRGYPPVLRIDAAHGLSDGASAMSIGWCAPVR